MIRFVHRNPKFDKRLEGLHKEGKKAANAARKAREIIDRMVHLGGRLSPEQFGGLTHYGEARIANCLKYDLGAGYRMVCISSEPHLFLMAIGTHDECHRWIENNRGLEPAPDLFRVETLAVKNRPVKQPAAASERPPGPPEGDFILGESIAERDLRRVFRGLTGEAV
ncbi:MAG: hypothetical protein WAK57_07745 [Desulfobacterales bacterium]